MNVEQQIEALLQNKFEEPDFLDCFLIELKLSVKKKLEIFIDSDSGMTFEKCQKISRYLEGFLDSEGWLGTEYTLEVSSPGISRSLKFPRQYIKNIGRTLDLTLADGSNKTVLLKDANETFISIEEEVIRKEKNKKIKEMLITEIPYEQIKKAFVKIIFKE